MLLEAVDGRLVGTMPLKTAPMNQGKLCIKGWNAHGFVHSPERLTSPRIRKHGKLEEVSWDEAYDFTVNRLREIKTEHGGDSIGFFASARCTNEDNYLLQKLCRAGFGTNNIDHCARL
jgi:formate dehydrogenase alpha subunit